MLAWDAQKCIASCQEWFVLGIMEIQGDKKTAKNNDYNI